MLTDQRVSYTSVTVEPTSLNDQSVLIEFYVTLNESSTQQLLQVSNVLGSSTVFGGVNVLQVYSGVQVFVPSC